MLGFEVCTPQRDMKDRQVRQRTWTVLRGNSTNAKKTKNKKRWKMGRWPLPCIQQYRLGKRGIAHKQLGSRLTNGLDAEQSLR